MNLQKLKLWTDALRSNEFEQGEGYLCKDGKYCCMGVAAEVAMKDGVELKKEIDELASDIVIYDEECAFMPNAVRNWLECPSIQEMDFSRNVDENHVGLNNVDDGSILDLIYLNDKVKLTFKQIADVLDKEFLKENKSE